MKKTMFFVFVCAFLAAGAVFAQGGGSGRIQGKLTVGATPVSQGSITLAETLSSHEGQKLAPGQYRVAISLNSLGEASFVLSPFKVENPTVKVGLEKNAVNNNENQKAPDIIVGAKIQKNALVRGIASNIQGKFSLDTMTPSEAVLKFDSPQFAASAILGRAQDSKLVDLKPSFLSIEDISDCGAGCVEGRVKVTIHNDGNSVAKGKWNVVLSDPQFFVGSVADVGPDSDVSVISQNKVKFPCCNPQNVQVEVHSDFYNKDGIDSNESNNIKAFTVKLK
ncbi:MAG TPA: hypothetical protein VFG11_05540 [Acidobacteriota bacterium]|nr:hypothetical protein [Acidobacteriota bacterium]